MPFTIAKNISKNPRRLSDKFLNKIIYDDVTFFNFGLIDSTLEGRQARFNYYDPDLDSFYINDLTKLKSLERDVYALDFVADNFLELKNFVKTNLARGVFTFPQNDLVTLEPRHGYNDTVFTSNYDSLVDLNYNSFIKDYLVRHSRVDRIRNFDDFIKEYFLFAESIGDTFLITRDKYISSKFNNSLHNGLTIEISDQDPTQTAEIYEKYFDNPNFQLMVQSANRFGFFIDKNAPWRLIANLNSPIMQKKAIGYMVGEEISEEDTSVVFRRDFYAFYYQKAFMTEIENLKNKMFDFYNNLIQLFPDFVSYTETCRVTKLIYPKEPITREVFKERYSDAYWLKAFFDIRLIELGVSIEPLEKQKIEKTMTTVAKEVDTTRALRYTQSQLKRLAFGSNFKAPRRGRVRTSGVVLSPIEIENANRLLRLITTE